MKKPLILLAVPALFVLGCKPKAPSNPSGTTTPAQPKACFSVNKTLIDSGETIITTNCSKNASSYYWNFGLGLLSSSTATAPSFTYSDSSGFNPVRGNTYKVYVIAYGTGSLQDSTSVNVTVGERQLDSVVVSNVPGFVPDGITNLEVQFGPGTNTSKYTSPTKAPSSWPCTFNLDALGIKIGPTNDMEWSGRIINSSATPPHTITVFQNTTSPLYKGEPSPYQIYFSRGVNVSPIVIKDHSTPPFELDFYYTVVK